MQYKFNRVQTFGTFPNAPMVSCIKPAANGFFFTGIEAVVECCECRECHNDWQTNDVLYHDIQRLNKPPCSFLDARDYPLSNVFFLIRSIYGMQGRFLQESDNREYVARRERGEGDTIRFFHCNIDLRNWLAGYDSWAEHARFSFEFTFLKINIMQAVETVENSPVQVNRRGNNYYNEELERLKAENENLRRSMACIICKEREAVVLFLPCSHLITCLECAPPFVKCPICGTDIEGAIRVFRA